MPEVTGHAAAAAGYGTDSQLRYPVQDGFNIFSRRKCFLVAMAV